jgi:hypothetical protein
LGEAESLLVHDEFPILPVYFYTISGLLDPHVHGFYTELVGKDGQKRTNLRDLHPLREVSIGSAP